MKPSLHRSGWLLLLAVSVALIILSACAQPQERRMVTYASWQQADPIPEPKVLPAPVQHVVIFPPGEIGLTQANELGLLSYLGQTGVQRGDTVGLGVANPIDPATMQSRLAAVRESLNRAGVTAQTLAPLTDPGITNQDQVVLTTYRYAPVPLPCPGYASPVRFDGQNRPVLSLGCSVANNLAFQVLDPADLVEGRPLAPGDAGMTLSIQRYRTNQITPLEVESTTE